MKKFDKHRFIRSLIIILSLPLWLYWDISQASHNTFNYKSFSLSAESKANLASTTNVAIVRSDDTQLANPSSVTSDPSSQTVEQMVKRAINLAGGFPAIRSGMTVLIKPNLVESDQPSGSGTDTDVRVVEAVVKYVDEIDHGKIKIVVGDGSPRPYTTFEKAAASGKTPWGQLYGNSDANKDAGYQKLLTRMLAAGIDFRLSNLNGNSDTNPWSELLEVNIPGGGVAQPQNGNYHIHQDVINADVYITVPVMKIHDPGITCALKNQIGLAPSSLYGFSKTAGVTQIGTLQSSSRQHMLLHTSQAPYMWTDKEIVDLSTIAKIKYAVVDALMCLEVQKTTLSNKSNQVRMNMIIAGQDPVAVDNVAARLIGLNPDDIEHITLAERVGLGTNDPDKINIVGADLTTSMKRFKKNTAVPDQVFGQGNRNWILSNSYSISGKSDPINYEFIPGETSLLPLPGENGWSQSTYFINDRINLKDYYSSKQMGTDNVVGYAFTYFTAPADQEAELWVGSDEALKIYLNGSVVYNFNGTRTFSGSTVSIDPATRITIKKGLNSLLVKILQKISSSYFDFSLNICSVESDFNYRGSRVSGLKFIIDPNATGVNDKIQHVISTEFALQNCYPNPFNNSIQIPFVSANPNEKVTVSIYNMLGEKIKTIYNDVPGAHFINTYWNGTNDYGQITASGSYIVVLKGPSQKLSSKKIVFLK
jgi:uncharacterized protein (DUF362 family)